MLPLLGLWVRLHPVERLTTGAAQPNARLPEALLDEGYQVIGELGRGGMGTVYKVREVASGREVALKLLHRRARDPRSLARFLREGQVAAALDHPGIVKVHSCGQVPSGPYLTYELVPGCKTLDLALAELSLWDGVALLRDIARALGYAHEQGVVHRDVKPDNVLVDDDGRARVADFGLCTGLDADGLTQTGEMLGTPSYMAPEQFRGKAKEAGPQSDVWGMGVVLYELLAGCLPFRAGTIVELTAKVIYGGAQPPRAINPAAPKGLEAICLRCLSLKPGDRYADGNELADELDRAIAGDSVLAAPKRTYRGPIVVMGIVAAALVGVVLNGSERSESEPVQSVPSAGPLAVASRSADPEQLDPRIVRLRNRLDALDETIEDVGVARDQVTTGLDARVLLGGVEREFRQALKLTAGLDLDNAAQRAGISEAQVRLAQGARYWLQIAGADRVRKFMPELLLEVRGLDVGSAGVSTVDAVRVIYRYQRDGVHEYPTPPEYEDLLNTNPREWLEGVPAAYEADVLAVWFLRSNGDEEQAARLPEAQRALSLEISDDHDSFTLRHDLLAQVGNARRKQAVDAFAKGAEAAGRSRLVEAQALVKRAFGQRFMGYAIHVKSDTHITNTLCLLVAGSVPAARVAAEGVSDADHRRLLLAECDLAEGLVDSARARLQPLVTKNWLEVHVMLLHLDLLAGAGKVKERLKELEARRSLKPELAIEWHLPPLFSAIADGRGWTPRSAGQSGPR